MVLVVFTLPLAPAVVLLEALCAEGWGGFATHGLAKLPAFVPLESLGTEVVLLCVLPPVAVLVYVVVCLVVLELSWGGQ